MSVDATKDYYATLGVLPTAEPVVIRAAFKALAQRYHPDRFNGSQEDAHRRMTAINEAYSVLSDSDLRREYDRLRGAGNKTGNSYFDGHDAPPDFNPSDQDWALALTYFPDLKQLESRLGKLSWRLAHSFRAYLLEEKTFKSRELIAHEMENNFIELYFGTDDLLKDFARDLIKKGHIDAAKALNQAVRVLGSENANIVISRIKRDFPDPEDYSQYVFS